jgi:uncharacterized protein (TIGR03435 family)
MTRRVGSPRQFAVTAIFLLAFGFSVVASAYGQAKPAGADTVATKPPAFEVVSVKLSKPGCDGMMVSSPPGRFSAQCTTLMGLLFNAFPTVKPSVAIPGLPGWANSVHFDVDAKADDETAVAMEKLPREEQWKQTQTMLQAALAERFKLRTHNESREGPIYELVVAKGGFKLKEAPASEHSRGNTWSRDHIAVRTGPIGGLVFALSDLLSRNVVDKTGLSGNYDIDLRWTPDEQQGTPDAGPTLFTALEEQLGLKLVPAKGPVEIFVVDHVERATEN